MPKYITKIEVNGLWGESNLCWNTNPSVNILSGSNGSGKSTILRCLGDLFRDGALSKRRESLVKEIIVTFDNQQTVSSSKWFDPHQFNVDVVSTFDMTLRESDAINKLSSGEVITELDWELYRLHTAYLNYQLEVSKQIITALTQGKSTDEILAFKKLFLDTIDSLFSNTGKSINREDNALSFTVGCRKITPYQLSSGEKQILIILTTVLIQNHKRCIMIMDEPEISLHFDWQRRLIEDIMLLNPNLQLILATHSPAVIMDGWVDNVSEIGELSSVQ